MRVEASIKPKAGEKYEMKSSNRCSVWTGASGLKYRNKGG